MRLIAKILFKIAIFIYLLYFAFQILSAQDFYQFARVDYLKNVNIVFHEAGHTVFALFGDFLRTLGGSFLQVFVPLMLAAYFLSGGKKFFPEEWCFFGRGKVSLMSAGTSPTRKKHYCLS